MGCSWGSMHSLNEYLAISSKMIAFLYVLWCWILNPEPSARINTSITADKKEGNWIHNHVYCTLLCDSSNRFAFVEGNCCITHCTSSSFFGRLTYLHRILFFYTTKTMFLSINLLQVWELLPPTIGACVISTAPVVSTCCCWWGTCSALVHCCICQERHRTNLWFVFFAAMGKHILSFYSVS